jgi:sugar transferase (PEP-CTERM/EpsH1 system associated)
VTARQPPLIAHVIFRFGVGGLENGLVNLINRISPVQYRHAVVCIDRHTEFMQRLERKDVEIISIGKRPGTDFSALWRLQRAFRRLRPDIVHTRNLGGLDGLLPAVLAGVRYRIHGEHGWDVNDLYGSNRKLKLLRRLHAPMVDHYIALSRDQEKYLIESIRVPAAKVTQLYNGVDTELFHPDEADRAKHSDLTSIFGSRNIVIGTVGRLEPVKNQITLVDAFVRLLNSTPNYRRYLRLAIIGDGKERPALERQIDEADIRDLVWIAGARDDIPTLMRQMDVFALPSLAEGVSNTVLEAMGSGLPVVATNVGGNPELVLHNHTGILVPPARNSELADALRSYIDDEERRRSHGLAGRKRAEEHFSIEAMVRNYVSIYDRHRAQNG